MKQNSGRNKKDVQNKSKRSFQGKLEIPYNLNKNKRSFKRKVKALIIRTKA